MTNSAEATMDFLDGSDVDEDNVGDVDQDVENVLLGSDDEESHPTQHFSRSFRSGFMADRGRQSEADEEEDVLNLVLQGDEEPLDFGGEAGPSSGLPPVKIRTSMMTSSTGRESHEEHDGGNASSGSQYEAPEALMDDNYVERKFAEDDDYEDADDESENRNTRSRFTSERNVESFNNGGQGASSVGIPIQTVGERKIRPVVPDGRPKHWNHPGPRQLGPRFPGRNHRFPRPGPPMMGDHPHPRPHMNAPPVVQFNDGIFTDFNQPLRHPHPRQRQPSPGRFDQPRHPGQNMHRHPMNAHPPNMMGHQRPNLPPPHQQGMRPFFPPHENQMRPSRPPNPGMPPHQQQLPPPQRPDFNLRGQRPPRFNPNINQRNQRPPHMNNPQNMPPHMERPPFPPRPQRPPFRHEFPHDPTGMNARPPNPQGFPAPPNSSAPGGFNPHAMQPHGNPGRFVGPPGVQNHDHNNPFYVQSTGPPNYHPGQEHIPFPPDAQWNGAPGPGPMHPPNQSPWMQQQPHHTQQQNYNNPGYSGNAMIDPAHRPANQMLIHPNMLGHHQLSLTLQPAQQLDISQQIPTSIYIKPNSEIHEALSKGHFRPHVHKEEEMRQESTSSSHRHYDDHYRDRERSSSSRRAGSPTQDRRREDDDYYDDRKSYHHHDYDRRSRRKYDDDRRGRSASPEKKISRSERPYDSHERREREKEKEVPNKDAVKLMEDAKKMGLGEDYVKKLEEQRKLRERILKTKEQRRKQVKVAGSENDNESDKTSSQETSSSNSTKHVPLSNSSQKLHNEKVKEIEADSTVATNKSGKPKKILRIVRDKSGKIISKKVHVVLVAKPHQESRESNNP